jgi:serine/threonine protein kinase
LREDGFARDRFVKVLDFGLAKLTEPETAGADPEALTIPITATSPGAIIGTSGYMSPEQAEGDAIDSRSDIFSLGVVLYEMVAGQPPFKGRTDSHTRVSILDHEPTSLLEYSDDVPRQLERIVSKALAKDRAKRYQTVTDLKLDLEQLRDELRSSHSITLTSERLRPTQAETIAMASVPTHKGEPIETLAEGTPQVSAIKRARRFVVLAGAGVVLALLVAALIYWRSLPAPITSVAILPFVNQSNDPNADYLSDGITESITNSLSQLPGLTVMSRNAAFRFKNAKQDRNSSPLASATRLARRSRDLITTPVH